MKKILLFSLVSLAWLLTSCSDPYKYFGKSYPPVNNTVLYFREADVPEAFEVMGKMDVVMDAKKSTDKIQQKILQAAASHGADAVIVDDFQQQVGGYTTAHGGGSKSNKNGGSVGGGVSSTEVQHDIAIKATLVKYKKNIQPATGGTPSN